MPQAPTTVTINGGSSLRGSLRVPGDKSVSHRAVILAALADGESRLTGLSDGADVEHTLRAVAALGAVVERQGADALVRGGDLHEPLSPLDVGNSGTGIRLLAGVAGGIDGLTVLSGDDSVARRPMERVVVPLRAMGAMIDGRRGAAYPPLVVRGGALTGIDYDLPMASAQVKGALLLAGLSAEGPTTLREPRPTRMHTEEMLLARGIDIRVDGEEITVQPSRPAPFSERIPGDPSQAAFWVVAGAIVPDSDVAVSDVYLGPARTAFLDVLRRMGGDLEVDDTRGSLATVRVRHSSLTSTDIGADEVPELIDEIPILAVAASHATGTTRITGAEELRHKESDRVRSTARMLRAFGAEVTEYDDGLAIVGGGHARAGKVDSEGDHRIAMSAAVAALAVKGASSIHGMDAVETSYPGFLADLASLGGEASPCAASS